MMIGMQYWQLGFMRVGVSEMVKSEVRGAPIGGRCDKIRTQNFHCALRTSSMLACDTTPRYPTRHPTSTSNKNVSTENRTLSFIQSDDHFNELLAQ